jgi:hypothetical protein
MSDWVGQRFAAAVAKKDRTTPYELLDPAVDFRGMTPGRFWETTSAPTLVDDFMLGTWFGPDDHVDSLQDVQCNTVADRGHFSYRMHITNPDGAFVVEQQAYYGVEDGRINYLRIMCSGYRALS